MLKLNKIYAKIILSLQTGIQPSENDSYTFHFESL